MTVMLTCRCGPPQTNCSLQQVIKQILEIQPGIAGIVEIYTGGLASQGDTGNLGPSLPHLILTDQGPVSSIRAGEDGVQHTVLVTFQWYTTTEEQGLMLAKIAWDAILAAAPFEVNDGEVCVSRVPGRARSVKLTGERWLTQVNQTFIVHVLV